MKKFRFILTLALAVFAFGRALSQGIVSGWVHEQDSITPIEGVMMVFSGIGASGDTLAFQFLTDTVGCYMAEIEAGTYQVVASATGYADATAQDSIVVESDSLVVNFILNELYLPVSYVAARQFAEGMVRVSWSLKEPLLVEDFESGDFGQFNWSNGMGFPWTLDTVHAYEGNACMKSGCEGVDGALSQIEVAVYVPADGTMSFVGKVSSESPWDVAQFFIDGEKRFEASGESDWEEHLFAIGEGEHVFRWSYQKDASSSMGDDCFYVDDIRFLRLDTLLSKEPRSLRHFDLFRRRSNEPPVMLVSHLSDTLFMDMTWESLPWGRYSWGVSCHYEGNRADSDTVWSALLDKDMTTSVTIGVTTNIGLPAVGAWMRLSPIGGQGDSYQADIGDNGHLLLPEVYRGNYTLSVGLAGFEDYVSTDTIPIFEPTQLAVELREAIVPIDSLYVSSTGWAVWQLADERQRGLQHFEVMLDSVCVGTTTERFFQFGIDTLVAGRPYTAQVRPVYVSDTVLWHSAPWTCALSDDFQGCGQTLQWSLTETTVELSWQYPENGQAIGAVVYRDGEYLGFVGQNAYSDQDASMHGLSEYCVRIVYGGPTDGTYFSMSSADCVEVDFPSYCDPPANLEAERYWESDDDYGAVVYWGERPAPVHQWLRYDDGQMVNALGGNGEPIFWSVRFGADTLAEYVGCSLKKVALFDGAAGTYQLWVYVGGDTEPHTLVRSQNMTLTGRFDWHEETLFPELELQDNEPVWIVVGQQGVSRPAVVCADMGHPDGRWVYVEEKDGWTDMHTYNMHYTWMLRAYVSNRAGRTTQLGSDGYALQNFNLYRSIDGQNYQQIAAIPYAEGQPYYQYRDGLEGCSGNCFRYRLTASYLSEEGEACESDYASVIGHPEQSEVVVCDPSTTDETMLMPLKVYPNPASNSVIIEADGMHQVMLYNVVGQKVVGFECQGNSVSLDLTGLENGLYVVRVTTPKGILTKPFVLSR